MPRFFMAGTNILGGMAIMKGRDAEHVRVLRLRPGEDMIICDGQGTDYKCRLVKADKEQVEAEVIEVVRCPAEPSVKVTVLCGLPKGDKTDYIIQKSVEAGAEEILFFNSDRCVARPDKPEKKLERWQRIAEEAAKQSGRGIIPQVGWAGDFAGALDVAVKKELGLFMMHDAGPGGAQRCAGREFRHCERRDNHRPRGRICTVRGRSRAHRGAAYLLNGRADTPL